MAETDNKQFAAELQALAEYIRHAKEEIASIRPLDISASHIPMATDELDAVIGATEDATNKILDVCDEIAACAEKLDPAVREKLVSCNTRIFEACNFQDITGQRITKVVNTLKHIDGKVNALLVVLGETLHPEGAPAAAAQGQARDTLLNGPQLPGKGIDQDAIDQLLAEK